ncbi:unnamed protein product, partial [Meganyctiphanes norvegica]
MSITKIFARSIFDSRGNPTVEVDLYTEKGLFRAAVPSGASTGIHEALEMRDGDKKLYHGKSVFNAVKNVNDVIVPELIKSVWVKQTYLQISLRFNVSKNGAKFQLFDVISAGHLSCQKGYGKQKILAIEKHISKLAGYEEVILPCPAFNVINGGTHAGNKLAMQEFMILPTGAESFTEAMKMGSETYHHLKSVIKGRYGLDATAVGDEGGFAPNILNNKDALQLIQEAIEKAGYTGKIEIGMDVAASEFYKGDNVYDLDFKTENNDGSQKLSGEKLCDLYMSYVKDFPITSIEDPFDQDDWDNWTKMTSSTDIQIVGDDLTVTNPTRIQTAVDKKACNCLLLKVNQIGSVTEAIDAHLLAKKNGWGTMVSHRSGETEDTFIADLVVGLRTGQIKTGAPCRSERTAKYNQILRIEEELGDGAKFAGKDFRNPC